MMELLRIVLAAGALLWSGASQAQAPPDLAHSYPTRPVRVIVPYGAGGPTDVIARIFSDKLSANLGQAFFVVNHPGASSNLGTGIAAAAPGDGYTLLFVTNDVAAQPALSMKLPYDPVRSFSAVTLLASAPEVFVVHPSVPARTMSELIKLAKADTGKYQYASPGARTTTQMSAQRLFLVAKVSEIAHVPFPGGAAAIASTYAGHTQIAVTALPAAAAYLTDGSLRGLAITAGKRSAAFPHVQTLEEAGFVGHTTDVFIGVVAPAGTPVVDKLNREFVRISALPDVRQRMGVLGFDVVASPPEAFAARLRADSAKWEQVAREIKIEKL